MSNLGIGIGIATGALGNTARNVLASAAAWFSFRTETTTDLSPNGYDLQLGSTAGADTNDPTFVAGEGFVHSVDDFMQTAAPIISGAGPWSMAARVKVVDGAAGFEVESLAVTNLTGEYGVRINRGDNYQVTMPANWDPNNFTISGWVIPDWDGTDGSSHCFLRVDGGVTNYVRAWKFSDSRIYVQAVIANVGYSTSLSGSFITAGVPFFFGMRLHAGTLTVYADNNGDASLETASVSGVPQSAGSGWVNYVGSTNPSGSFLEGAVNLLITNDGSSTDPITDRFNAGAGRALGGDMGWLARASGNGLSNAENLVLHVGGNADGTSYQLDTAHNATDLLEGTATGRVDLPPTTGYVRFGNTAEFDGATKVSFMFEVEHDDVLGTDRILFHSDGAGFASSSITVAVSSGTLLVWFSAADNIRCNYAQVAGRRDAIGVAVDLGLTSTDRAKFYLATRDSTTLRYGAWSELTTGRGSSGTIPAALATEAGLHQLGGSTWNGKFDTFAWKVGTAHDFTTFDATDIVEPKPWKWDHAWTFDGDGTDLIGSLTATVTGGSYVDDGRHHLGRMERFTKQGQYYFDGVDDKITHGNYSALDGATYAVLDFIHTPQAVNTTICERGILGGDGQVRIANEAGTLAIYLAASAPDVTTFGYVASTFNVGQSAHVRIEIDGTQGSNATRLVVKTETYDATTGLWSGLAARTVTFSGTIPATLLTPSTGTTLSVAVNNVGTGYTKGLFDRFALHAGSIPASKTPYESGASSYDIWCDYNGGANNSGLGGATYNGTVTGAIQWYDGRRPEGWTKYTTTTEVDRATAANQSSEGTFGPRLKAGPGGGIYVISPALAAGRWVLFVGAARETSAQFMLRLHGGGFAGNQDSGVPTQASLGDVGQARRVVTSATAYLGVVSSNTSAEAYIDNLRALQLATVSPSTATQVKPIRTIMAAHKYGYAYPYFGLFLDEDESVQYHAHADDGTEYGPAGGDTILADGSWHTLAVTNNGTTLTVWIDGVAEVTTLAFAGAYTGITKFLLGALVGGTVFRSLQGETIKGAGVWTRALAQPEIQRLDSEFA